MRKISIKDNLFAHAFSSSGYNKPSYFEWDRDNQHGDFIFLTDSHVFEVDKIASNIKKYAWLAESPVITPNSYKWVYENSQKFDLIFTHSKKILELKNEKLLPIGGCHLDSHEISLEHEKNKLISMMYSFKNFATGHNLRFSVAENFSEVVDVMGSGIDGKHVKKIESCRNYMFSVVIENCKEDCYFSEKIIDCFLSGVIPIYWGCPSIDKFFNKKGMFEFDNILDLYNILKDQEFLYNYYINNKDIIEENFNIALKYKIAEDYLWDTTLSNYF